MDGFNSLEDVGLHETFACSVLPQHVDFVPETAVMQVLVQSWEQVVDF